MIIPASLSSLLSVKKRRYAQQTSRVRMWRQRQDAFTQFCLQGSRDPLPRGKKSRMQIPSTRGWVFCKSMITVLYFNIFCIMLWVFNMLRHQRHRLRGDCLTAVLLIKSAEVSPLSWRFLFCLRHVTETASDHNSTVFLNSPQLGCDVGTCFRICNDALLCSGWTDDEEWRPLIYETHDQGDVLWLLSTDCKKSQQASRWFG